MTAGIAEGQLRLPECRIREVTLRILEVRMVEEIKEVRVEAQLRAFRDLERLADAEVPIGKHRARNRVAAQVGVRPATRRNGHCAELARVEINVRIGGSTSR